GERPHWYRLVADLLPVDRRGHLPDRRARPGARPRAAPRRALRQVRRGLLPRLQDRTRGPGLLHPMPADVARPRRARAGATPREDGASGEVPVGVDAPGAHQLRDRSGDGTPPRRADLDGGAYLRRVGGSAPRAPPAPAAASASHGGDAPSALPRHAAARDDRRRGVDAGELPFRAPARTRRRGAVALNGTLRDFGLADIFQLIGIQRKTGVLSLRSSDKTVTVSFLSGGVVSAESSERGLEDRLGSVLVKSGKVTERQLGDALKAQKASLQRLGKVLIEQR